jgi:hypothetical protein
MTPPTLRELLAGATPGHKTPRCYSDAARERLMARLDPATMGAVLEALERARDYIASGLEGNPAKRKAHAETLDRAIGLLNGTTEAK